MESNIGQLPPSEAKNSLLQNQWRSSYNAVALKTLEKFDNKIRLDPNEMGVRKGKLGRYLDAIDTEVADNFQVFESQKYPGVRFPHTVVSVNKVAGLTENPTGEKLIYVLFTPFSPPPGGDADDVMNSVYDRVFSVLSEIKNDRKDITVHVLGLPTSRWGSVSKEWVDNLEKGVGEKQESPNGFPQYGNLYAEFLKTVLDYSPEPQNKERVRFYGSSMGSILASETARQLPEIWKRLRVLVDVPTGTHKPPLITVDIPHFGKVPLSAKGLQILLGFGAEYNYMMRFDNLVKTSFAGKKEAQDKLISVLQKRGMVPHESEAESSLKKAVFLNQIKLLIRGTPFDTEDFRSYVVQGMLDPATVDFKRILFLMKNKTKNERFFKAGSKHSLGMGIDYTHWMDRGRWPTKWIGAIEQYEKLK